MGYDPGDGAGDHALHRHDRIRAALLRDRCPWGVAALPLVVGDDFLVSERRQTHLGVEEVRKLDHWCRNLRVMFHESLDVIHVGSSLVKPDYRDVDIRIVVEDEDYVRLSGSLNVKDLNMLLSYWGREQTGLPIDCQVQSLDVSSDEHDKLLSGAFPIPRGLVA